MERKREERRRGQNQKSKGHHWQTKTGTLPLDFDWKAALFLSESQASMSTEEVCNETTEVVVELAETAERKTGQKFQTPSPGYADRVFYESLLEQRPDSEMAQEWCVQYGILPEERAAELWKLICKRKAGGGSPNKKSASSSSVAPKKRKKESKVIDGTAITADTGRSIDVEDTSVNVLLTILVV